MSLESPVVRGNLHLKTNQDFQIMSRDHVRFQRNYWKHANKRKPNIPQKSKPAPIIPSPTLFQILFSPAEAPPHADGEAYKSHEHQLRVAHCAVHLELLEAFHRLRLAVQLSTELDNIFGLVKPRKDQLTPSVQASQPPKWERFVEMAVVRFQLWFDSLTVPKGVMDGLNERGHGEGEGGGVYFEHALPPLDVLMVWHAFLLNPKKYRMYCVGEKAKLINLEFPWAAIHRALTPNRGLNHKKRKLQVNSHYYTLSAAAANHFRKYAKQDLNLLDVLSAIVEPSPNSTTETKLDEAIETPTSLAGLLAHFSDLQDSETLFRIQLRDAVLRQNSFILKMSTHLWLRSPAVFYTLSRATDRYDNFLKLFKYYPGALLVPTLDIDIAWHTSQLSAASYHCLTTSVCGRFINHDDTLGSAPLARGLEKTSALYRARFGDEYSTCLCWECQALMAGVRDWESSRKAGFRGAGSIASHPRLSSLNGEQQLSGDVVPGEEIGFDDMVSKIEADVMYYRCAEIARRNGSKVLEQVV